MSVIVAALICGILSAIPSKNAALRSIQKTLCGIFMSVTLISPLTGLHLPDLHQYLDAYQADAAEAVLWGQTMTQETTAQFIKQQTASYILDKAAALGVSLDVSVTLSVDFPQVPCAVTLRGMVSPYAKQRLMDIIEQDLQIKREDQHWINTN
jgi:hypothetical protein